MSKIIAFLCCMIICCSYAGEPPKINPDKYSEVAVLNCEKSLDGAYEYRFNSSFIGKDKEGLARLLEMLAKMPDYSLLVVCNLTQEDYEAGSFYDGKSKDLVKKIKELQDRKNLIITLVRKTKQLAIDEKNILLFYIPCNLPIDTHALLAFYHNKELLGYDNDGERRFYDEIFKNKNKLVIVVHE